MCGTDRQVRSDVRTESRGNRRTVNTVRDNPQEDLLHLAAQDSEGNGHQATSVP